MKTVHFKTGGLKKAFSFICITENSVCILSNDNVSTLKYKIAECHAGTVQKRQTNPASKPVLQKRLVQNFNLTIRHGSAG
jgi:hypothetical protein